MNVKPDNGITELMKASSRGSIADVEALLGKGVDVNARDIFGHTALMYAVSASHAKVLLLLLDYGADLRATDTSGLTALALAQTKGHDEIVRLLKVAALLVAARDGDSASVNETLASGAQINAKLSGGGWTALMVATVNGHAEIVRTLLDKGADPHVENDNGWTALMIATRKGFAQIAELLKERGAQE